MVQLQSMRVGSARTRVNLAAMQQERARIQERVYTEWIDAGLNEWEHSMIDAYKKIAELKIDAMTGEMVGGLIASYLQLIMTLEGGGGGAGGIFQWAFTQFGRMRDTERNIRLTNLETRAQTSAVMASYERQKNGWELGRRLARQDIAIGDVQIIATQEEVAIEQQQEAIASLRLQHAEAIVQFLATKFTSFDLYDWMSGILEEVYRFFLNQATATARMAERQLAFERHSGALKFIKADYWRPPVDEAGSEENVDRRGMTGSARLARDVFELDQFAFQTNRQKHEITRTISLATLDPYAFEQFRELGVLQMATPMELFDRDYPGHYLRLVRRVRTTVVALVPPSQGIRAVLSTTGLSRVVVGDERFSTVTITRDPESVALSAPYNATGLFELETQGGMRFPLEWMGVDAAWELRMPKASNPFDYGTLLDVLLTIEYTALDSARYRRRIEQDLTGRRLRGDRALSFRHELADQWYDLNNVDSTAAAIRVDFETEETDFPPNLGDLKIERVALYFAYAAGRSFTVPVTELAFTPRNAAQMLGGPSVSDSSGLLSSRDGGTSPAWGVFTQAPTPFGQWSLTLPNTPAVRDRFNNGDIDNLLFVMTYSGVAPAFPS
jgi:hypothetical protein